MAEVNELIKNSIVYQCCTIYLVAGEGFEPTTFRLWAWRATKLLYPAILCIRYQKLTHFSRHILRFKKRVINMTLINMSFFYLRINSPWEMILPVFLSNMMISFPPNETLIFWPILKATPPKITPVKIKLSILILIVVSMPAGMAL